MASPRRRVAQLVELWSPKPVVVGSSPAAPATTPERARGRRPVPGTRGETKEPRPGVWRRFRRFVEEAWSELRKVTWPTREQVRNLTVLVFVLSAIIGVYITVFDLAFTEIVRFVAVRR